MDSAENFTLGGLSEVQAYPSGEASVPQGQKLSFEMRYLMNKSLILTPFYDWGMVEKEIQLPLDQVDTKYQVLV